MKMTKNEKLERVHQIIEKMGNDRVKLPRPTDDQFKIMAFYVQTYNFIELNARRSLETLARANLLNASIIPKYREVRDAALYRELRRGVRRMDPKVEDIEASTKALEEIELKKDLRNKFAHYAARDIPGEDCLLLLTKDHIIFEKQFGIEMPAHSMVWAVVDMANVRGATIHMQKYEKWIAKKAAEWFERYETAETIAALEATE